MNRIACTAGHSDEDAFGATLEVNPSWDIVEIVADVDSLAPIGYTMSVEQAQQLGMSLIVAATEARRMIDDALAMCDDDADYSVPEQANNDAVKGDVAF